MDWSNTPESRVFIARMSKKIVAQTAPEELDLADELLEDYFKDPRPPNLHTTASDDPLGFGADALLAAATPAAAAVASAILGFFISTVYQLKLERGGDQQGARQVAAALLQAQSGGAGKMPPLTAGQLEQLRKLAVQIAGQYGMDQQQSWQMANALVVALVLPPGAAGGAAAPGRKVKILFLTANPQNAAALASDEEARAIDRALQGAEFQPRFELVQHWAVRVTELQELLLRHRPEVVHFSGHGSQKGAIILEDGPGNAQPVSAQALGQLFHIFRDQVRLVVLNACYSLAHAGAIASEIDCVIGMGSLIDDRAALGFASGFYRGLGYGRDIQAAFELGISQISLAGQPDQAQVPGLLALRKSPAEIVLAGV